VIFFQKLVWNCPLRSGRPLPILYPISYRYLTRELSVPNLILFFLPATPSPFRYLSLFQKLRYVKVPVPVHVPAIAKRHTITDPRLPPVMRDPPAPGFQQALAGPRRKFPGSSSFKKKEEPLIGPEKSARCPPDAPGFFHRALRVKVSPLSHKPVTGFNCFSIPSKVPVVSWTVMTR
jgi:hypothetical protein